MQPRTHGQQRCYQFSLNTVPKSQINAYQDHLGNMVHHFNIPGQHVQLKLTAESLVEVTPRPTPLPEALPHNTWAALDRLGLNSHYWDMQQPSQFTTPTPLLNQLAQELNITRQLDPLTALYRLNEAIYSTFAYVPNSTQADSPIDEALAARKGVCQDFTHIMIALVRQLGIPCQYVSGYLFHREEAHDRSAEDATHAWCQAYLPELGWVGFDPTNNLIVGERHIRVAIGRDYADVPPTRGVFKGEAESELSVGVRVTPANAPPQPDEEILPDTPWTPPATDAENEQWQQQQ